MATSFFSQDVSWNMTVELRTPRPLEMSAFRKCFLCPQKINVEQVKHHLKDFHGIDFSSPSVDLIWSLDLEKKNPEEDLLMRIMMKNLVMT